MKDTPQWERTHLYLCECGDVLFEETKLSKVNKNGRLIELEEAIKKCVIPMNSDNSPYGKSFSGEGQNTINSSENSVSMEEGKWTKEEKELN